MRFSSSLALSILFCVLALEYTALHAQSTQSVEGPKLDPNWARQYVAEDPLVAQRAVTLDDIKKGLESERRRGTVIDRHFTRVQGTADEKRAFLAEALRSPFPEVQRQAARALAGVGQLEGVVRELLLNFLQEENAELRQSAVIALEQIDFAAQPWPEQYWSGLIESLASEDPEVSLLAAATLRSQGASAVPALLAALKSPEPSTQRVAAQLLTRIVGSKPPVLREGVSPLEPGRWGGAPMAPAPSRTLPLPPAPSPPIRGGAAPAPTSATPTQGKARAAAKAPQFSRKVDPALPNSVRVYFGTNREVFAPEQPPWSKILFYPVVALLLLWGLASAWSHPRIKERHGWPSRLMIVLFGAGLIWTGAVFRSELLDRWRIGTGPRFGPHRDANAAVHYGTCDVTIPPKHKIGAIEKPLLGPEDENLHVVLQKTEEVEAAKFFDEVRAKVAELPRDKRSCFVFIHGFNVTFENAAKRTAQIHYDMQFSGIPIFFSWPSRASIRHYFSDRNEIEFSRYVIKQFLLDVSQKVDAERIHVIAHSMGADATCRAISELGDHGKIFDQIILAAPDIDRDVFRLQLAPRMARSANRTTMYCSKNDWALLASNTFNDAPRAGDSRDGVLVIKEVDTIDATGIDTDLLGHSYYGDCLPVLNDVRQLVLSDLPPDKRKLRPWPVENELIYWTLANLQPSLEVVSVEKAAPTEPPSTSP